MAGLIYDRVIKYDITAITDAPLRIGNSNGSEEVLVHPVDNKPFIQASSIAGALRSFSKTLGLEADELFGNTNGNGIDSRIKVSDGLFQDGVKIELRPHVRIDRKTGSVSKSSIKGTKEESGQKYNMEYIGTGQTVYFSVLLYDNSSKTEEKNVERILSGVVLGDIRFGGKKSIGAGILKVNTLKKSSYDLRKKEELAAWIRNESVTPIDLLEELKKYENEGLEYYISIKGKTEGGMQIRGLAENNFGENAADSSNIKNLNGEYIIPGSSFKGAVRTRMEMIATYLGKENIIDEIFGKAGEDGYAGNIIFRESIVNDESEYNKIENKHRLHIDKFTGGVIDTFQEKNIAGEVELNVEISKRGNPQLSLGLLLFALRDLACGLVTIGNGYANGKGVILVSNIEIIKTTKSNQVATINYTGGQSVNDEYGIIDSSIVKLKEVIYD